MAGQDALDDLGQGQLTPTHVHPGGLPPDGGNGGQRGLGLLAGVAQLLDHGPKGVATVSQDVAGPVGIVEAPAEGQARLGGDACHDGRPVAQEFDRVGQQLHDRPLTGAGRFVEHRGIHLRQPRGELGHPGPDLLRRCYTRHGSEDSPCGSPPATAAG